jgi:hypothetical protein
MFFTMVFSLIETPLLVVLVLALPVQAGWYYDLSCTSKYSEDAAESLVLTLTIEHLSLLNKAVPSALDMYSSAFIAIGRSPGFGAPEGTLWEFPDVETRDLTGRIFGDLQGADSADKFQWIRGKHDSTAHTMKPLTMD